MTKGDLAIAGSIGFDVDDLPDYRYHIDGTSRKVYGVGDNYFCSGADPEKDMALRNFSDWKKFDGDQHSIETYKTMVWVSVEEFIHPDDR